MTSLSPTDLYLSFAITWIIVIAPPAIFRWIFGKPLYKPFAVAAATFLFLVNVIIFTALGSQSKSHGALVLGVFVCYYILRWQTKASAGGGISAQRKRLGYDDWPGLTTN